MRLTNVVLLLLIVGTASAQYAFESKKAEKLYYKLDDAYLDYDYATILENEEEAKSTFLSKEDTVAANVYSFLGEAYYFELGELQKALDFYNLELNLRSKIQPNETQSSLLFSIAGIQAELGYYEQAEEMLTEVIESDEKEFGKGSEEYFTSVSSLVTLYTQAEKTDEAISVAKDLRKNVRKGTIEEAVTYKWIGDALSVQGSFKKAEKSFFDGLEIFQKNGLDATFEYVSTLNSLGIAYLDKGLFADAEKTLQESLNILIRLQGENDDVIFGIKSNLAQVYLELGDFEEAINIQREVVAYDLDYYGESSFVYAQSSFALALFQLEFKQYAEAQSNLEKVLKILKEGGSNDAILAGRAQSTLSRLFYETGYIEQAIEFGQQAIETYKSTLGEEHPSTAFPYSNLANAHLGYEEIEKAEPLAEKAYEIRKKRLGTDHPFFARSANQMAIINWKKGEADKAMDFYQETFDNYFKQINAYFPVLTEEEKAKFYYTNLRPAFEQYISFIQETAKGDDRELVGEIYDYQLALKGLIMYATTKVRESILSSGDEALIAKYEEWISQKEQLAKLFSATDLSLTERNKKIDSLTEVSNKLEEELSKGSKAFGKNFANRKLTWRDVQKTLKPGEAAVEVVRYRVFSTDSAGVFTPEVHYAALIVKADTEDYPEMVVMRNGADMEKKFLANYRNAIRFKIAENYSYRLFWRPIANRLEGVRKIYFAPDGVYNQISIYTLQNPQTKEYLLNEIDLAMVTNTKDLISGDITVPSSNANRSVFFGYPDYNLGDEATGEDGKERGLNNSRGMRSGGGEGRLERGATIPRGIRGNLVRYMRSFNGLSMLPGTKKEVELIDSLYQEAGQEADVFLLNEAVENKIKEMKSPSTLHIATHGFFLELDPAEASSDQYVENPLLRSGVILAGANSFIRTGELAPEQGEDDGILTAFEAMNLNLDDTEVVVLSACETGLGEIKNGEGVYGLQRAFQIAGADAIIMSMWTVDDAATQELMTRFYAEWLEHGDKQKAFNAAQKQLKEKYKKPYYWGAFVMVGG